MGRRGRRIADKALGAGTLGVCAISFWEVGLLFDRRRIRLDQQPSQWRREVMDMGVEEIPVTGDLAIEAARLTWSHADPSDRFIVVAALREGATLLTADTDILEWRSPLKRHDART
jgi:PIN domain nuclease of toxin-antitoxin system